MKLVTKGLLAISIVALAACGVESKKADNAAPKKDRPVASEQDAKAIEETLPSAVIIRVPTNDKGEVDNTKAEARLLSGEKIESTDALASAFEGAKAVDSVKSEELDSDSSTQSWFFPRYRYNYGSNYNYHNYYYSYRPSYSYYNYSYPYNYYSNNYSSGYTYYYYPRSYSNSYCSYSCGGYRNSYYGSSYGY